MREKHWWLAEDHLLFFGFLDENLVVEVATITNSQLSQISRLVVINFDSMLINRICEALVDVLGLRKTILIYIYSWCVGVFVLFFPPQIAFLTVLMLCGSDGKGEVNLLCCIFLCSCKVENKWERLYFFFPVGFSGFILQKCFSLSFLTNEVLLHSLFLWAVDCGSCLNLCQWLLCIGRVVLRWLCQHVQYHHLSSY